MASEEALEDMARVEGVVGVELTGRRQVRLVVDDAGARMLVLRQQLEQYVGVLEACEVIADYDEVFIRLVADARRQVEEHE